MHIESVSMEGWKTYQFPITIPNFDPEFNAISGHNGSGKSNILDAVQFVLGCNDNQLLRIKHSLTELIYKDGAAGITHASVTVKFSMKNRRSRPAGYEDCESLSVTRSIFRDKPGKFHVNGSVVTAETVRKMFYSMNLNVENPHFIVKQGQITKIVQMKPAGVLAMMEQAVGTGSYIKTREQTMDIIRKNDLKLTQMNLLVDSYIIPRITKISTEKQLHSIVRTKETQHKVLNQKVMVYGWLKIQDRIEALTFPVRNGEALLEQKRQLVQNTKNELSQRMAERVDAETALTDIRNDQNELESVRNTFDIKQMQYDQCFKRITNLKADTNKTDSEMGPLASRIANCEKKNGQLQGRQEKVKREIEKAKQRLTSFNQSIQKQDIKTVIERQAKGYEQRLMQLQLGYSRLENRQKDLQNGISLAEAREKQNKSNSQGSLKRVDQLRKEIEHLKCIQRPLEVKDPESAQLNNRKRLINADIQKLLQRSSNLKLRFQNPPVANFKRENVRGRMFEIFEIKDPLHFKAIQVGVGGRLNNIVVMDDVTSSQCLTNGVFGNNVSVIPNNKIGFRTLSKDLLLHLQKVGAEMGGFAKPAYDLLEYPKQLQSTIKFAFSTFVVVSSKEIGKSIAFNSNRNLRIKCVTLDGDVMDPQGTLSGGYFGNTTFILQKVIQLRKLELELNQIDRNSHGLVQEFREYQIRLRQYDGAKKELELKVFQLERLEKEIRFQGQQNDSKSLSAQLEDVKSQKVKVKSQIQVIKQTIQTTRGNMSNSNNSVGNQRKILQAQINSLEAQLKTTQKQANQTGAEFQQLTFQLGVLKQLKDSNFENIGDTQKDLTRVETDLQRLKSDIKIIEDRISSKTRGLDKEKLDMMVDSFESMQVRLRDLRAELAREEQTLNDQKLEYKQLLEKTKTILEEQPQLPNHVQQQKLSIEDYPPQFNYEQQKQTLTAQALELTALKNKVVTQTNSSDQRIQKSYAQLRIKIQQMHKDKEILLQTIKELDQRRIHTLQKSCTLVKDNFRKIFKDMYPSSTSIAELTMADPQNILKGFELGMSQNGMKKNMGELSGGQKSLLSLAFILGLLLYRPCPFYFLDEIDAALDEVHTENIGQMISERFPQSQFIIISLKETMFRNANVLYNICFINGKSEVTRTDNRTRTGMGTKKGKSQIESKQTKEKAYIRS